MRGRDTMMERDMERDKTFFSDYKINDSANMKFVMK